MSSSQTEPVSPPDIRQVFITRLSARLVTLKFKLGHCDFQNMPLKVETGQYHP